jgi:hypothetical protein
MPGKPYHTGPLENVFASVTAGLRTGNSRALLWNGRGPVRLVRIIASIVATALLWSASLYWVIRIPGMAAASYALADTALGRGLRQAATATRHAAGANGPETDDMLFIDVHASLCLVLAICLVWAANRAISRVIAGARLRQASRITA